MNWLEFGGQDVKVQDKSDLLNKFWIITQEFKLITTKFHKLSVWNFYVADLTKCVTSIFSAFSQISKLT